MIQVEDLQRASRTNFIFGQLCSLFTCSWGGSTYCTVLVHTYDALTGTINQRRDQELRFLKLREKARKAAEFMFADSIVRGALIAEDYATPGDHLVVDPVDPDMWVRLKGLNL